MWNHVQHWILNICGFRARTQTWYSSTALSATVPFQPLSSESKLPKTFETLKSSWQLTEQERMPQQTSLLLCNFPCEINCPRRSVLHRPLPSPYEQSLETADRTNPYSFARLLSLRYLWVRSLPRILSITEVWSPNLRPWSLTLHKFLIRENGSMLDSVACVTVINCPLNWSEIRILSS